MENFLHYLKYTLIVARIGFLSETENITGQNCIHLLTYFKKKELKLVTDCISRCILSRHSFLWSYEVFSSVHWSVMSDFLWPHELQHGRPPCPSPIPGAYSNSCPHVHHVGDAIQLSHPLSSPSYPAFSLSHHQGLFQWVSSSQQLAKIWEFQLQHQSFQWIFRTDSL